LHLKRVGEYWSVRIGLDFRAVGVDSPDGIIWSWIGPHDEYVRLVTASGTSSAVPARGVRVAEKLIVALGGGMQPGRLRKSRTQNANAELRTRRGATFFILHSHSAF